MKPVLRLAGGFACLVLAIESLHAAAAWWRGELAAPGLIDVALILVLPLLAWAWWRYLSPFASGRGQCLLPGAEGQSSCRGDSSDSAKGIRPGQ